MWKNDDAESGMFTKNPACWNCYEKKTACWSKIRHVEVKSGMLKIRQKNGMCLHRSFCWCDSTQWTTTWGLSRLNWQHSQLVTMSLGDFQTQRSTKLFANTYVHLPRTAQYSRASSVRSSAQSFSESSLKSDYRQTTMKRIYYRQRRNEVHSRESIRFSAPSIQILF